MLQRVEDDQLIGHGIAREVARDDERRKPARTQRIFSKRGQFGLEDLADDALVFGALCLVPAPVVSEQRVSIEVLPHLPQVGGDAPRAPERWYGDLDVPPRPG